jgi:Domain of unknown function (DUF397)
VDEAMADAWRKSKHSAGGDCVEWRFTGGAVQIRNSRDTEGPVLTFTHSEWRAFLGAAKQGDVDLPKLT